MREQEQSERDGEAPQGAERSAFNERRKPRSSFVKRIGKARGRRASDRAKPDAEDRSESE